MRKKVDPSKAAVIEGLLKKSEPQEDTMIPMADPSAVSIDLLMAKGLRALSTLMKSIELDMKMGSPARDTVMNLKDAMAMLRDLKKDERELLDSLSDEQLEQMLKDKK